LLGLDHPGEGKKIIDEKFNGWHKWEDQVISMGR
jgi:GDPmannose 4,6-dehydratase